MDGAQTDKAASSPVEMQAEISGLLARGAVGDAQRLLDTALAGWPKNPKLRLLEGEVLAAASPVRAAVHYAALIAEPALAPWALARLADLFPVSGLAGEDAAAIAEAVCSDAVERRFKEPILDALLEAGDAETKARLTEIAGTRSAIFKYESRLAVARTEAGDFAGAMAVLKRARDEARLSIHAAVLYADLLAVSGELGASIALLEELLAAHPEHADVSRRLTMMLQRARDFGRAAEVFEQAVARWPQDWMLVYRLNRLPVPRERYERILDLLFARAGDALENNERFRFQAGLAALHADDPARGFALLDRRFSPPVSILAMPVQKALKARAPKAWREASRLADDRTKEVQVTRSAGARATVVLTTGIAFGNLPLAFVDTLFAAHGINVVYLRDFAKRAYLRGVSALGASEEETTAVLKRMAAELGAKRLIAMGSSSGGFSALRVGALMGADAAVSFSGPTAIASFLDQTRVSAWNPNFFVKAIMEREGDLPFDLVPLLSRPSNTKFIQFYGADSPDDVRQARRLEGLPGVTLLPVPGIGDHFVVDHMIGDGSFEALLGNLAV
jgi:thioredoxin-like negative regulator of GroEL